MLLVCKLFNIEAPLNDLTLNIIGGIVGGIISGLFIYLIQVLHQMAKDKKANTEHRTIKVLASRKIVKDDIFLSLRPGVYIETMKQLLGPPTKYSTQDNPIFAKDSSGLTNAYLYVLNNAYIKITSEDNLSIDSITVFPTDKKFRIYEWKELCDEKETRLNRIKVNSKLIELASNHTFISSMKDNVFAIETFIPNPLYNSYTFFGYSDRGHDYLESEDINLLNGGVIIGICIASQSDKVHYIYEYEKMSL